MLTPLLLPTTMYFLPYSTKVTSQHFLISRQRLSSFPPKNSIAIKVRIHKTRKKKIATCLYLSPIHWSEAPTRYRTSTSLKHLWNATEARHCPGTSIFCLQLVTLWLSGSFLNPGSLLEKMNSSPLWSSLCLTQASRSRHLWVRYMPQRRQRMLENWPHHNSVGSSKKKKQKNNRITKQKKENRLLSGSKVHQNI